MRFINTWTMSAHMLLIFSKPQILRSARLSEGETADGTESKLSELHAATNYLRKGMEIMDMQLEFCKQEITRPKMQMRPHGGYESYSV